MKIGFFTALDAWGGSESYLKELILGVRAAGHETVLFGVEGTRTVYELRKEGVQCVVWRRGIGGLDVSPSNQASGSTEKNKNRSFRHQVLGVVPGWAKLLAGNAREVAHLCRVFAANPVDLMHIAVHGYEVAGIACRLRGMPCLAMNMISPVAEPNWIRRRLLRYTMRAYDHVSSQSAFCTNAWIRFSGLRLEKCSFVWSSADTNLFRPECRRQMRSADAPFRMVSAARLHPMKGHRYVIEAVKLLNDKTISLDIYGEGSERAELQKLIDDWRLTDQVILRGNVENVHQILPHFDCFVLASISHESCPAALPEAMACGLPLITSDFGPLPEVNVDGLTGRVVPMKNAFVLAEAIGTMKENPEACVQMAQVARGRACWLFSRERMVRETLELYARVKGGAHDS